MADTSRITNLYPGLTEVQKADAEYRLLGYLAVVKRIFDRVCEERPEILTELERCASLRRRGSSVDASS